MRLGKRSSKGRVKRGKAAKKTGEGKRMGESRNEFKGKKKQRNGDEKGASNRR